ncbi:MAG TPA: methyltransferase domain-containing protein, partial [Acidimicrobiales bacterium]|nr:methyltransferase domain-containing protein [Acidimicrobiales bacterium]
MDDARRADALCERLSAAVPAEARVVVQVGRGPGWLGPRLPGRVVHRVEATERADDTGGGASGPDAVRAVDLARDPLPFEPGTVDAIVYADALPRLHDPLGALRRHGRVLRASGAVVCSAPNLQHHGTLTQLLRGDFHYAPGGPLDPSFVHLFTATDLVQLLLDAGFVPDVAGRIEDPGPGPGAALSAEAAVTAGAPLLELLGVGTADARRDLATGWLVVGGVLQEPVDPADEAPLTVVACVNDDAQLEANLLRSPCLAPGGPHEVLLFRDRTSAAEGLNAGIEQARNERVVLVHQDVYLPEGWPARLARQWRRAAAQGGP